MSAALSPDGRTIAAGENSNVVFLWDATSGKEIRRSTLGSAFSRSWTPAAVTFVCLRSSFRSPVNGLRRANPASVTFVLRTDKTQARHRLFNGRADLSGRGRSVSFDFLVRPEACFAASGSNQWALAVLAVTVNLRTTVLPTPSLLLTMLVAVTPSNKTPFATHTGLAASKVPMSAAMASPSFIPLAIF
jgi:hypothetical protein